MRGVDARLVFSCGVALAVLIAVLVPGRSGAAGLSEAPGVQPGPPAGWTVAGEDTAGDWRVYASGSSIADVALDDDSVWVATSEGGLLRWDRRTGDLIQYLAPQTPLPSNYLSGLLLHDDKLYVTWNTPRDQAAGVAVFDREDGWNNYTDPRLPNKLGSLGPLAMVGDVLWVGGDKGLAQMLPDGHWEIVLPGSRTFPELGVERIEPREDGVYVHLVGGLGEDRETALVRYASGVWESIEAPAPGSLEAPDGSWWRGELGRLLKSTDQGLNWQIVLKPPDIAGDVRPRPLAFDQQGRVCVSDDGTLLVLDQDVVVERYRYVDVGPELHCINEIEVDSAGRVWIGTDGLGLTMFDGQQWHNWQSENSDLQEDAIRDLFVYEDRVYAAGYSSSAGGDVSVYDTASGQWQHFRPGEGGLSGRALGGVSVDAAGRVYVPTALEMLDIHDNGQWQRVPLPHLGVYLYPSDGLFDADGNYWLAAQGLWRYDGTAWTEPLNVGVNALALDPRGYLWAATDEGLAVRDLDGVWYVYSNLHLPLGRDAVIDVALDAEGRAWALTHDSLVVFNGRESQAFTPDVVMETYWRDAVALDGQGHAWVATSWTAGVAVFQGQVAIGPFAGLVAPDSLIPNRLLVDRFDEVDLRSLRTVAEVGLCAVLACVGLGAAVFLVLRRKGVGR